MIKDGRLSETSHVSVTFESLPLCVFTAKTGVHIPFGTTAKIMGYSDVAPFLISANFFLK
jgi:hypothetical protein